MHGLRAAPIPTVPLSAAVFKKSRSDAQLFPVARISGVAAGFGQGHKV
jgi:hypothetical protein